MAPCGNGCFWHVASVHGEAAQGPESENTADLSLWERRLAVGEKKGTPNLKRSHLAPCSSQWIRASGMARWAAFRRAPIR